MFNNMILVRNNKASMMIASYFAQFTASKVLVGKPLYKTSSNKVVVQIPYFAPQSSSAIVLAETKMNALGLALTSVLGQCELRFVRLRYPYLDSNILSQYLAINAGKYSFTRLQKSVFNQVPTLNPNSTTPTDALFSVPTGVELELAGRLNTQRNIPRKTVNNAYTGSLVVNNNTGSSLDFGQYVTKNKLGAYTVKV